MSCMHFHLKCKEFIETLVKLVDMTAMSLKSLMFKALKIMDKLYLRIHQGEHQGQRESRQGWRVNKSVFHISQGKKQAEWADFGHWCTNTALNCLVTGHGVLGARDLWTWCVELIKSGCLMCGVWVGWIFFEKHTLRRKRYLSKCDGDHRRGREKTGHLRPVNFYVCHVMQICKY